MSRSIANKNSFRTRRHVALIIETSLASGRAILQGVARYLKEGAAWSIYHEPRGLDGALPSWLGDWQGDGIIVRAQNPRIAEGVLQTGLPVVDVLGVAEDFGFPLVHVDNQQRRPLVGYMFEQLALEMERPSCSFDSSRLFCS